MVMGVEIKERLDSVNSDTEFVKIIDSGIYEYMSDNDINRTIVCMSKIYYNMFFDDVWEIDDIELLNHVFSDSIHESVIKDMVRYTYMKMNNNFILVEFGLPYTWEDLMFDYLKVRDVIMKIDAIIMHIVREHTINKEGNRIDIYENQ